jgi:hypothetical protein
MARFVYRSNRALSIRHSIWWVKYSPILVIFGMALEVATKTLSSHDIDSNEWQLKDLIITQWNSWFTMIFSIYPEITIPIAFVSIAAVFSYSGSNDNSNGGVTLLSILMDCGLRIIQGLLHYFVLVGLHRFVTVYLTLLMLQDVFICEKGADKFVKEHLSNDDKDASSPRLSNRIVEYFKLEAKVIETNKTMLPFLYVLFDVIIYLSADMWHFKPKSLVQFLPIIFRHTVQVGGM